MDAYQAGFVRIERRMQRMIDAIYSSVGEIRTFVVYFSATLSKDLTQLTGAPVQFSTYGATQLTFLQIHLSMMMRG